VKTNKGRMAEVINRPTKPTVTGEKGFFRNKKVGQKEQSN
jgi:hypothetical protein